MEEDNANEKGKKYRLIITVREIKGNCPVFKVGDKIVMDSPKIVIEKTDNLCIHAFGYMLSMLVPLSRGISFKNWDWQKKKARKDICNV